MNEGDSRGAPALGNHAAGNDALLDQVARLANAELGKLGGHVRLVTQHARHVRH